MKTKNKLFTMFTISAATVHIMISTVLSVLEITSLLAHLGVNYIGLIFISRSCILSYQCRRKIPQRRPMPNKLIRELTSNLGFPCCLGFSSISLGLPLFHGLQHPGWIWGSLHLSHHPGARYRSLKSTSGL